MGIRSTLAVLSLVAGLPPLAAFACLAWVAGDGHAAEAVVALAATIGAATASALVLGQRWLRHPLARLAAAAQDLRDGALRRRIGAPHAAGEVGSLMSLFDSMAAQCEHTLSGLKDANAELEAANRALEILKDGHRILLNGKSEASMCSHVCRVVVEIGGYRHACIAIAAPAPHAGLSAAAMERAFCFPDSGSACFCRLLAGATPNAEASRTGREVAIDDIAACEPYPAWRDHAQGRGCVSAIALPLSVGSGPSLGALTVYATRSGPLPQAERELLAALASDLAFGLHVLRLHEREQRHESELERRVSERTAQLEASNLDLESFSYSVSHDLRAPLRAIDGFSHLVATGYADRLDAHGAQMLESIRHGAQRMGNVIDALMDFSRIGRPTIRRETIDMRSLVMDVIAELGDAQSLEHIAVDIGSLPEAQGDGELIRRVWSNLLSNAVKYSSKAVQPRISIGGRCMHDCAVYEVRDNGAGFDMQHYDKLFRVFERLHRDTDFPGTGIGLATVQRIVKRHGGDVWAHSAPDAGATFHFSLPRADNAQGSIVSGSPLRQIRAA